MVNIDHKPTRQHLTQAAILLAFLALLWGCEFTLEVGPENYAAALVGQIDFRQDAAVVFDEDIVAMAASGETVYIIQHSAVVEMTLRENPDTGNLDFDDPPPTYALPLGLNADFSRLYETRHFWQVFPGEHPTADVRMLYNSQTGDRLLLFRDGMSAVLLPSSVFPSVITPREGTVFFPPEAEPATTSMGPWRVEIQPGAVRVYDSENSATWSELIDIDGYTPIVASTDANNVYVLFESPPQDTFPYISHRISAWDIGAILFDYTVPEPWSLDLTPESAPGWQELRETLFAPIAMDISADGILLRYPYENNTSNPQATVVLFNNEGLVEYVMRAGSDTVHNNLTQLVRSSINTVSIMRWQ